MRVFHPRAATHRLRLPIWVTAIGKWLKIHKTRSTAYHPQSDGFVERFNRTLLTMLSSCAYDHLFNWEYHLWKVCCMAYNSSIQSSTGYTPFYLMFSCQACLLVDVMYSTACTGPQLVPLLTGENASQLQTQLSTAFDLVRQHISIHHKRQKIFMTKGVWQSLYSWGSCLVVLCCSPKR